MTRDVERAKKFYEETIGWTFSPMPMADGGTYWCATVEGKPIAFSDRQARVRRLAGKLDVLSRGR
jgi:predicted enzyme related to lactoylglutathione lyase